MDEPSQQLIMPIPRELYLQLRRILINAGQGGTFEMIGGREAIDMTGVVLVSLPPP